VIGRLAARVGVAKAGAPASGPRDAAFVTTFALDEYLLECGPVTSAVLSVVDSAARVQDPIRIGRFALPADAFDPLEIGALELHRGTRGDACFAARIGADETPAVDADFGATAYGRPVRDGTIFRLRPAPGQDVIVDYQVKESTIVHPALLRAGDETDPMSINLQSAIGFLAAGDGTTGCVHAFTRDDPPHRFRAVDGTACQTVVELSHASITLRPASGGDTFPLRPHTQLVRLRSCRG
jgi:hypothetical protein